MGGRLRFTRGALYRHRSCLDIDILIANICFVGPKYAVVKVFYILQRNEGILNPEPQTVRIQKKDWPNWTRIEPRD